MERYKDLEEILESRTLLSKKLEEAFSSLPKENWMPLNRPENYFPVNIYSKGESEMVTPISYEIRNTIEQNNPLGKLSKDENGVYFSAEIRSDSGKDNTYMVFYRKIDNSYKNVAFADYNIKKVVFDSNELGVMDVKQLRAFAYAINQYLNGNYDRV